MDTSVEEIIKSIVQIDKTAEEMRQSFEMQIKQRKQYMNKEIEVLREEIVESEVGRVKERRNEEIKNTMCEAEKIREGALIRSKEMYQIYLRQKEIVIQEIFNNVLT